MVKTPSSKVVKARSNKAKPGKKKTLTASVDRTPAIEFASLPDERLIRERAYGIWIEEGRPHGRDLAHWQRARHELSAGG